MMTDRPQTAGEAHIAAIIADVQAGKTAAARRLQAADIDSRAAARMLRIGLVPLLAKAGAYAEQAQTLQYWLDAANGQASDWLMLSSALTRAGRADEADAILDRLGVDAPSDPLVATARIQLALRQRDVAAAAALAVGFDQWSDVPARAAHIGMLALLRAGRPEQALALAAACDEPATPALLAVTAEAHLAAGHDEEASRIAQRALGAGHDTPEIRHTLANIAAARFEHDKAITHLTAAATASPDDLRTLASLGELLLMQRRPQAAHAYLTRVLDKAPDLTHVRALAARALKDMRDYEGAARQYGEVLVREPQNPHYRRQAAAAFRMAGDDARAEALIGDLLAERCARLPESLEAGLDALWGRLDEAQIPQARFDWAWGLRGPDINLPRDEWERRARWGWLADRLVQDWLEVSPERAEEAMHRLADLSGAADKLETAARDHGGLILASAHIGPLYAGPLALQLLDFPSVWLASTPSVAGIAYSDLLISTSDQTEAQVVRQTMAALDRGASITIAVDGAITAAAPRLPFEGQEVTYSAFAARIAHRRRTRSFFVAPQWRPDWRLEFVVEPMPFAEEGEALEVFSDRWRDSWFAILRRLLAGAPENLRMGGGIWRHIRPPLNRPPLNPPPAG